MIPWGVLAAAVGSALAAVAVVMAVTFVLGRRTGRYSIVDAVWGPGFVVATLVAFLVSPGHGDPLLRAVMLVLVGTWGLRLGIHILLRNHGLPEDGRYVDMLRDAGPWAIARKVQMPQGLTMWFVSLPAQVAMVLPAPSRLLLWLGVVIWVVGFAFEAVGDSQLRSFKADPANNGRVMDRGLWRYTRHPNYFGEATMWWGVFVMICGHPLGLIGLASAALMTWLLVARTGKALTEKRMSASKPGYRQYLESTSGFIPLPPKKRAAR